MFIPFGKKRWCIEFDERNVEANIKSFELASSSIINCIGNIEYLTKDFDSHYKIFLFYFFILNKKAKTKYSALKREGLNVLAKIFELLKNGTVLASYYFVV
jgi:hypothetical protein